MVIHYKFSHNILVPLNNHLAHNNAEQVVNQNWIGKMQKVRINK